MTKASTMTQPETEQVDARDLDNTIQQLRDQLCADQKRLVTLRQEKLELEPKIKQARADYGKAIDSGGRKTANDALDRIKTLREKESKFEKDIKRFIILMNERRGKYEALRQLSYQIEADARRKLDSAKQQLAAAENLRAKIAAILGQINRVANGVGRPLNEDI